MLTTRGLQGLVDDGLELLGVGIPGVALPPGGIVGASRVPGVHHLEGAASDHGMVEGALEGAASRGGGVHTDDHRTVLGLGR